MMNRNHIYYFINAIIFVIILNINGIFAEEIGFSSVIHFYSGDICISPIIFYGALIVGSGTGISICILCVWVLIHGRYLRRTKNFKNSSRASISSKTGLYNDH